MISASLLVVSQALAQGVSTKQECSRGQEAPKGTGKRRQTAANVCPCTHKCTKCICPFCPQVVYKPFGKTHTDTQTNAWTKTHKHNDNKKTQKQPVPTLTQLYKLHFVPLQWLLP